MADPAVPSVIANVIVFLLFLFLGTNAYVCHVRMRSQYLHIYIFIYIQSIIQLIGFGNDVIFLSAKSSDKSKSRLI